MRSHFLLRKLKTFFVRHCLPVLRQLLTLSVQLGFAEVDWKSYSEEETLLCGTIFPIVAASFTPLHTAPTFHGLNCWRTGTVTSPGEVAFQSLSSFSALKPDNEHSQIKVPHIMTNSSHFAQISFHFGLVLRRKQVRSGSPIRHVTIM